MFSGNEQDNSLGRMRFRRAVKAMAAPVTSVRSVASRSVAVPTQAVARGSAVRSVAIPTQSVARGAAIRSVAVSQPMKNTNMNFFQRPGSDDGTMGDFGRSWRKTIRNVVKAPVKVVTAVTKPVVKITSSVVKPIASVAGKIVPRQITNITKAITKPVIRSVVKPAAAIISSPFQTKKSEASVEVAIEAPSVTLYAPDGTEATLPGNLVVNGKYTENGVTWSTTKPAMVKIYSVYGDVAEIPETLIVSGKYTDQDGNVWTTTPTVAQQVASTLTPAAGSVAPVTPVDASIAQKIAETLSAGPAVVSSTPVPQITVTPQTVTQQIANALAPVTIEPVVPEGPMVTIYAPDGTEGEVPSNYIVNGTYTEDGIMWSTTKPEYEDEEVVPQSFWQKFLAALKGGNSLSGLGEDDTVSMLERLTKQVEKGKAMATSARKLVGAVKGPKGSSSAAPAPAPMERTDDNTILGLPPAVVYGGATVTVAGLAYALYRMRQNKGKSKKR